MKTAYRLLFAGMLAIVFSATAVAHDGHKSDWNGALTVAVTPGGHVSLGGVIGYGPVMSLPAHRVAYVGRGHRAVVLLPSHRYSPVYRGHYRQGKSHGHHHPGYRPHRGRGHGGH